MEKAKTERHFYQRLPFRIVAGVLAASLLISVGATAAISVKIKSGDESQAATNYLVDSTDYVNAGRLKRFTDKLKTLGTPTTLEDYYRLASTQIASEQYDSALESVDKCLDMYIYGINDNLHTDLLLKRACLLVILKRYDEALEALDEVLTDNPELSDAYLIKAQIYAEREENDLLAEALVNYLTLCPEDNDIRALLAQAMFTAEDYEGATEQYRQILDTAPADTGSDLAETSYLYGLTCIQLGDMETAETNLNNALKYDNTLDGIYYYRGICRMSRGDYSGAISDMNSSIKNGSLLQLCRYTRGVCSLMLDSYDYDSVKSDLQYAADYSGSDADKSITQQAKDLLNELASAQKAAEEEAARIAAEAAKQETAAPSDGEKKKDTEQTETAGQNTAESTDDPVNENSDNTLDGQ